MGGKMFDINNIKIEKIIAHVLSPNQAGLIKSDSEIDVSNNYQTVQLITNHIKNIHEDTKTRKAKFNPSLGDTTAKICNEIIKNPQTFIPNSQKLATNLFKIMEKDKRISDCDLVICLFSELGNFSDKFLALLKLDLSDASGFQNEITKVKGKVIVNIIYFNLNFAFSQLQKAAIIKKYDSEKENILEELIQEEHDPETDFNNLPDYDPEPEYDLLIVDRQAWSSTRFNVAKFFSTDFLGCDIILNNTDLTKLLYWNLTFIENKLITEEEYVYIEKIVLLSNHIENIRIYNPIAWMNELEFPESLITLVSIIIIEDIRVKNFPIDPAVRKKHYQKAKYQGSNGLIVEINRKNINNIHIINNLEVDCDEIMNAIKKSISVVIIESEILKRIS